MHVIRVAVVGRSHRDDRLQRRWTPGCDLQAVEAAPGYADHADIAGTPSLPRQPVDDRQPVLLLLRRIFIVEQAFGIARTPQVNAYGRIAVTREIGVHHLVPPGHAVSLAVGNHLENGRHGLLHRVHGHPCMRAARRVPSGSGIHRFSISRTWRGKSVTNIMSASHRKNGAGFFRPQLCSNGQALHQRSNISPPSMSRLEFSSPCASPLEWADTKFANIKTMAPPSSCTICCISE